METLPSAVPGEKSPVLLGLNGIEKNKTMKTIAFCNNKTIRIDCLCFYDFRQCMYCRGWYKTHQKKIMTSL